MYQVLCGACLSLVSPLVSILFLRGGWLLIFVPFLRGGWLLIFLVYVLFFSVGGVPPPPSTGFPGRGEGRGICLSLPLLCGVLAELWGVAPFPLGGVPLGVWRFPLFFLFGIPEAQFQLW